ncbi:MAG: hypothetical protein MZW92_23465 [Comamonadaceae bacterium]|nr:hypothetical protein [Comamonadaceae bacterium]
MKNLRASSYLNQVDVGNGTTLLYNGSTLCIDLVPTEYARLLSEGHDLSFLLPEEKQHLLHRGHLTTLTPKRELEEFRKLVHLILEKRARVDSKQRIANLCFILTYTCNLSWQLLLPALPGRNSDGFPMSGEFVDRFFSDYFPQLFPGSRRNYFLPCLAESLCFLLNREAIARILAYAKRRPSVRISVATNATTLPDMADLIGPAQGKIRNVQVTLDGDRLLHDENRILVSGQPTFDTTIAAVRQLIELQAQVLKKVACVLGVNLSNT